MSYIFSFTFPIYKDKETSRRNADMNLLLFCSIIVKPAIVNYSLFTF